MIYRIERLCPYLQIVGSGSYWSGMRGMLFACFKQDAEFVVDSNKTWSNPSFVKSPACKTKCPGKFLFPSFHIITLKKSDIQVYLKFRSISYKILSRF